jgi:hypothetical protein
MALQRSSIENLRELELKADILDVHIRNLARTLGVFHGFNERLRSKKEVRSEGASAISTIMFDQLHLISVRLNALIIEPRYTTDVSLQTFTDALGDLEIKQALIARAAEWHETEVGSAYYKSISARLERLPDRLATLREIDAPTLKMMRNKALAHITMEMDTTPPLILKSLWNMSSRAITLGSEVSLFYRQKDTTYADEISWMKRESRSIVGFIRAATAEDERRIRRANKGF